MNPPYLPKCPRQIHCEAWCGMVSKFSTKPKFLSLHYLNVNHQMDCNPIINTGLVYNYKRTPCHTNITRHCSNMWCVKPLLLLLLLLLLFHFSGRKTHCKMVTNHRHVNNSWKIVKIELLSQFIFLRDTRATMNDWLNAVSCCVCICICVWVLLFCFFSTAVTGASSNATKRSNQAGNSSKKSFVIAGGKWQRFFKNSLTPMCFGVDGDGSEISHTYLHITQPYCCCVKRKGWMCCAPYITEW